MADKKKRLRKILDKKEMRGMLKSVDTIEKAHLILVDNRRHDGSIRLIRKGCYLNMIEEGQTISEENVFYLIPANPRDRKNIEKKFNDKLIRRHEKFYIVYSSNDE